LKFYVPLDTYMPFCKRSYYFISQSKKLNLTQQKQTTQERNSLS